MLGHGNTTMLHFTVGTSPSSEINLENEFQVLKAALLYADKVKLCSLTTSMMLMIMAIGNLSQKQQIDFLVSLAPLLSKTPEETSERLRALLTLKHITEKKRPNKQELLLRAKFQPVLARSWNEVRDKIHEMLLTAGMDRLIAVIQSGLLEVHAFGSSGEWDNDKIIKEFVGVLQQTISDGSTYPLFDAQAGDLIRLGLEAGKFAVSESGVARGKHSGLAANLLERLPLFEEASVDEILDIRRELEAHLVRFRSAIIKFSEDIKTASWDADFAFEADQVFQRDVEPAILEIEEAVRSNSYLATLTRKFADKPLVIPSGSALAMLMSQLSAVPEVVTQALGVGAAAGLVGYDAYKEWQKQKQATERNQLYFYYKAGQLLSDRTYEYRSGR
jgi:hypothetical protein